VKVWFGPERIKDLILFFRQVGDVLFQVQLIVRKFNQLLTLQFLHKRLDQEKINSLHHSYRCTVCLGKGKVTGKYERFS
jgi:hypothetical protein